jgi:hypothetical protein
MRTLIINGSLSRRQVAILGNKPDLKKLLQASCIMYLRLFQKTVKLIQNLLFSDQTLRDTHVITRFLRRSYHRLDPLSRSTDALLKVSSVALIKSLS